MAYIEVHQSLRDHRKILALAAELDMPEAHVAGHCLFLWLWSLDNAQEGTLPASVRVIERVSGWQGESGALVAAMVSAGMLDRDEETGGLAIHDWWDYAGKLIEKRKEDAERKRQERFAKGQKSATPPVPPTLLSRPQDVRRTSEGRRSDGAGRVPYPTVENTTLPNRDPDNKIDPDVCVYSADEQAAKPQPAQPSPTDTRTPNKKTAEKPPDVLWQALLSPEGFGRPPAHKGEEREWRAGLAQLARASPDGVLALEELTLRLRRYKQRFDFNKDTGEPIPLSMRALVRNWGKLGEEQPNRGPTTQPTTTKRKQSESDQERYARAVAEEQAYFASRAARQQPGLAARGPADTLSGLPGARAGPGDRVAHPTVR